jgi:hypothetical protein
MLTHALQHVHQIVIDVAQLARHQQALRDAGLQGAAFGPITVA